jgi:hypothetical protein
VVGVENSTGGLKPTTQNLQGILPGIVPVTEESMHTGYAEGELILKKYLSRKKSAMSPSSNMFLHIHKRDIVPLKGFP